MKNKKLSNEETKKLLELWQHEYNPQAMETLVLKNMGLVEYFANRYISSGVLHDDLRSAGVEGLIKALNKFDLTRNIKMFSSYIAKSIDNEIKMELRKHKKHSKVSSLNQPVMQNEEVNGITIEDNLGTDKDQLFNDVISSLKKEVVRELLENLNDKEQQIIIFRYGLDETSTKTQKELANLFECSQVNIFRQEQKALIKMRHHTNTRKIKDFIES